jgi:hypothetical protein
MLGKLVGAGSCIWEMVVRREGRVCLWVGELVCGDLTGDPCIAGRVIAPGSAFLAEIANLPIAVDETIESSLSTLDSWFNFNAAMPVGVER